MPSCPIIYILAAAVLPYGRVIVTETVKPQNLRYLLSSSLGKKIQSTPALDHKPLKNRVIVSAPNRVIGLY